MNINFPESDDGPLYTWQNALNAGRFTLQYCLECKHHIFYPRVICPHCGASSLKWVQSQGTGTVYSATVIARRPEKGGQYNVVLVDLDEGVRLMSRVEMIAPEAVSIGMRVQHQIAHDDGKAVLVFHPLKSDNE